MKDLHFDIYIAAPPEAVWNALTQPEGVAKLYFGSRLETTFEPGSPYQYVGSDGNGGEAVHVEGQVLDCKRNEVLQLTHSAGPMWRKGPKIFTSRLTYKLEGLCFATKLCVVHDQWEEGDPGYAHNKAGWMLFLSSVKSYLETGKPLSIPMH